MDPHPDGAHAVGAPLRPPSGDLRSAPTAHPDRRPKHWPHRLRRDSRDGRHITRISNTSIHRTRTGTCRRRPSCFSSSASASTARWEERHERGRTDATSVFHYRLLNQRNASPRTVAAYRDTFRLLLRFAHEQTGKPPSRLAFADLDATLIGAFLYHLEHDRGREWPLRPVVKEGIRR
jgi:hypothetical protein